MNRCICGAQWIESDGGPCHVACSGCGKPTENSDGVCDECDAIFDKRFEAIHSKNFILIDDPFDCNEAVSKAHSVRALRWWEEMINKKFKEHNQKG